MNSLLVSLSTAMIAVIICAVVLICAGAVGVALGGKISANRKTGSRKDVEKPTRKKRESAKEVKPSARPESVPKAKPEEKQAEPEQGETLQADEETEQEPPAPMEEKEELPAPTEEKVEPTKEERQAEPKQGETLQTEVKTAEELPASTEEKEELPAPTEQKEQTNEEKTVTEQKPKTAATSSKLPEKKFEVVKDSEGGAFVRIRFNRSFTSNLIQSDDAVKNYYSQIKNELKKYGVKERISWRHETYRSGRKLIAKLALRGKTLCLYCATDPAVYEGTKYKVEDVSAKKTNAEVPALFRIKNDRRAKYSAKIIEDLMQRHNLTAQESIYTDYCAQYPYEELQPLIERKLVKLLAIKEKSAESEVVTLPITGMLPAEVLEEVSVTEAEEILPFENVEELIGESEKVSDRTKRGIVNVDELARYFENGERVTLEEIKRRIPSVHKKTTYIKVLARGVLDKPLEVEADDFSPAAVKMIVLTGGKVTRKK